VVWSEDFFRQCWESSIVRAPIVELGISQETGTAMWSRSYFSFRFA